MCYFYLENVPLFPHNLQEVTEDLKNYQTVIEALHEQAANLGEQVKEKLFNL